MFQRGYYSRMTESEIAAQLSQEGRKPQRVEEPPNSRYDNHKNPEDTLLAFVSGSAEIQIGSRTFQCEAGDRILINGQEPHSAVIGSEGCVYLMTHKPIYGD